MNLKYYDKLRFVPKEAQKPIQGGRLKGMTDINPMWRIKALTEEFGPVGLGWYYEVTDKQIVDGSGGEKVVFVDINLYVKFGEDWSKPIHGTGGSSLIAKEKNGLYTSDECFKMALTDAISVSCKALGVGADIYFAADRTKYTAPPEQSEQPKQSHSNSPTKDTLITFGKYNGKTIGQVLDSDRGYIEWLSEKSKSDEMRKFCSKLLMATEHDMPKPTARELSIEDEYGDR